jgi:hypothetical protein
MSKNDLEAGARAAARKEEKQGEGGREEGETL